MTDFEPDCGKCQRLKCKQCFPDYRGGGPLVSSMLDTDTAEMPTAEPRDDPEYLEAVVEHVLIPALGGRAKTAEPNPKDLIGSTKVDIGLVPPASIIEQARAMGDGARKYGPYNWREHPVKASIYLSAAMRHILAYLDGEKAAPDSGVHHLGHALSCMGIIIDAEANGNLIDDRPLPGPAPTLFDVYQTNTKDTE